MADFDRLEFSLFSQWYCDVHGLAEYKEVSICCFSYTTYDRAATYRNIIELMEEVNRKFIQGHEFTVNDIFVLKRLYACYPKDSIESDELMRLVDVLVSRKRGFALL